VTIVEERTVVQSYNRDLRVFGLVAVPAVRVTTFEDVPYAPIPCRRRAVVIIIPINTPVPTIPARIHSHLRVDVGAEQIHNRALGECGGGHRVGRGFR